MKENAEILHRVLIYGHDEVDKMHMVPYTNGDTAPDDDTAIARFDFVTEQHARLMMESMQSFYDDTAWARGKKRDPFYNTALVALADGEFLSGAFTHDVYSYDMLSVLYFQNPALNFKVYKSREIAGDLAEYIRNQNDALQKGYAVLDEAIQCAMESGEYEDEDDAAAVDPDAMNAGAAVETLQWEYLAALDEYIYGIGFMEERVDPCLYISPAAKLAFNAYDRARDYEMYIPRRDS